MPGQKTYWHLLDRKRVPTEYEISTSRLLYYPGRGFEVETPLAAWYREKQAGSPFACSDWERFADPRETTYTSYVQLQAQRETYVDGLLEAMDAPEYARNFSPSWPATLERVLPALRYPWHGLQMAACYVGHMAPASRIAIAALLQAADELRRVQRAAYRLRSLQLSRPGFGLKGREAWQEDPLWQPLREAVERLLTAYDWGEAFAALNLALKPRLDELLLVHFGELARRQGDPLLEQVLRSLDADARWQRDWSVALVRAAIEDRPGNREAIEAWLLKWRPVAARAARAFAPVFEAGGADFDAVERDLEDASAALWGRAGLSPASKEKA